MLRLIKFAWSVSLVAGLATLLYVYASLPENVIFQLGNSSVVDSTVHRETFFYISLGFLALLNFLLYAVSKNLKYKNENIVELLRKWQFSFAAVLNLFFIVVINFFNLLNSGERFNFDNFGYLIYVLLAVLLLWVLALPFLLIRELKK